MRPGLRGAEWLDRFVGALRRVVRLVAARLQAHQTECGVAVYPRDQEVKVISSSGHLAHEEHPARIAALIAAFARRPEVGLFQDDGRHGMVDSR